MVGRSGVVVVVTGGEPGDGAFVPPGLSDEAYVIAADSGLDRARALGLNVDLVVGDLDSVSEAGLAAARDAGTVVVQHPVAKDETDLGLALDRALERQASRVMVIGSDGGRLDHLVAGLLTLASDRWAGMRVDAWLGRSRVTVIRDEVQLHGTPGDTLTLLPVGGPARGVVTEGLVYPLADEDLPVGTTRGVSNELIGRVARVRLRGGVLLAIQPGLTEA